MKIIHFHNNTSIHKQTQYFNFLKDFFKNDDISFFEYLNSLNLDKSTYILSLRNKLTKLHIF
jgi:hypothetical protein